MRIASLVPSSTEILFAIGAGDDVVARTHECDHPAEATALPAVTYNLIDDGLPSSAIDEAVTASVSDAHTIYGLDESALADTEPDVVLTQSLCSVCAVDRAAVDACSLPDGTRVVSSDPQTLEEVLDSIVTIGDEVGRGPQSRSLAARLRSRLHWLRSVVGDLDAPRVAVIEWPDPIYAPGHWVPDMVEAAGGINTFGISGERSLPSQVEALAKARPEVVIAAFCGFGLGETQMRFKELAADPGFAAATRSAQIFAMDGSAYFSRPGPRLIDGIELIAWALHRGHERLRPPVGRGAQLIEAGWVDLASLPVVVDATV